MLVSATSVQTSELSALMMKKRQCFLDIGEILSSTLSKIKSGSRYLRKISGSFQRLSDFGSYESPPAAFAHRAMLITSREKIRYFSVISILYG